MKPLKLRMKAFGAYTKETVLDFNDIKDNLFLITGPTGAGKTTIFDAMSLALYGVSTGDARDLMMFRSDAADDSTNTEVEFEFEQAGRKYKVFRSLKVEKHRNGTKDVKQGECSLTGEGIVPVSLASKIGDKVTEIIGLNANQFRQIIVLPQGKFREFLESKSDKKNEILGKLFDNSNYVGFEARLDDAKKKIEKRRAEISGNIERKLGELVLPEEMPETERLTYKLAADGSNAEELKTKLQALAQESEKKFKDAEEASDNCEKKLGEMKNESEKAGYENQELENLEKEKEKREDLKNQEASYKDREQQYALSEKAYRGVYKFEKTKNETDERLQQLEVEKKTLETRIENIGKELEKAEEKCKANDSYQAEIERNNITISDIGKILSIFDSLAKDKNELEKTEEKLQIEKGEETTLTEKIGKDKGELKKLREDIDNLDGVEGKFEAAKNECEEVEKKLQGLQKIRNNDMKTVAEAEQELHNAEEDKIKKLDEESAALSEYSQQYKAFINGQAGLIASKVKEELEIKEEVECPVCHRKLIKINIPELTEKTPSMPTKEEVDAAENRKKVATNAVNEAAILINNYQNDLRNQKEDVIRRVSEIVGAEIEWDTLTEEYFEGELHKISSKLEECKNTKSELEEKCNAKKDKQEQLSRLKESIPGDEEKVGKVRECIETIKSELSRLRATIDGNEKQCQSYVSKTEAEVQKERLYARNNELENLKQNNLDEFEQCRKAKDNLSGQSENLDKNIGETVNKLSTDISNYNKAIKDNGFESEEVYHDALSYVIDNGEEEWLKKEDKAIKDYQNEVKNNAEQISKLEDKTKNYVHRDTEAIEQAIRTLSENKAELSEKRDILRDNFNRNKGVRDNVLESMKEFVRYNNAYLRISDIADLAVGNVSGGEKLKFDTYVMAEDFREVLGEATIRLQTLTNGRFELVHRADATDKRSKSGLEIDVVDNECDGRRNSASMSGGEGFLASLALALGLAEVVQRKAGGNKLDAIFIDEGFGSLDENKLDNAIRVLKDLTEGSRLVGVISHVDKLKESVDSKVVISHDDNGSHIDVE